MKKFTLAFLAIIGSVVAMLSCSNQSKVNPNEIKFPLTSTTHYKDSTILTFYQQHHTDSLSHAVGTVSNGSLINAQILPYWGKNFQYFSKESYLAGRCFIHSALEQVLVNSFHDLEQMDSTAFFYLMEASMEKGGKISPHRTHQNGTSIDLMIPLLKNKIPYHGLDTIGVSHYLLNFDKNGKYTDDPSIQINFDLLALEILSIQKNALIIIGKSVKSF